MKRVLHEMDRLHSAARDAFFEFVTDKQKEAMGAEYE